MNSESGDSTYTGLLRELRQTHAALAKKIEPKIYEYGFLKPNYDSVVRKAEQTGFLTAEVARPTSKPKESFPPFNEESQVEPKAGLRPNITVNIINNNKFEKPVGAVIMNGSTADIKDIIEIKKEKE